MKRHTYYLCLFALLAAIVAPTAHGQTKVQYWLDGNSAGVVESSMTGNRFATSIDVSRLDEGAHFISYRVKAGDLWSSARTGMFFVYPQAVAKATRSVEYWLDGNAASRRTLNVAGGKASADIDLSALPEGVHFLSYRVSDDLGHWSGTRTAAIFSYQGKTATATRTVEYWLDGNAAAKQTLNVAGGKASADIDLSALPEGVHFLSYRVSDDLGRWSGTRTSAIFSYQGKTATATRTVEYWLDGNAASRRTLNVAGGKASAEIDLSALPDGAHFLSYRVSDDLGHWSGTRTSMVFKRGDDVQATAITAAQYWLNDDADKAVTEQLTGATSPYTWKTVLNTDTLRARRTGGNVQLMYGPDSILDFYDVNVVRSRFRDSNGKWTDIRTDSFGLAFRGGNIDITNFIVNPQALNSRTGWKYTGSMTTAKGQHYSSTTAPYFTLGSATAESWSASMSQTVAVPAGNYMVAVKARGGTAVAASLTVNGESVPLSLCGNTGGEIWQLADEGSPEKAVNGGEGFGWNEAMLHVTTDGTPLTIAVEAAASGNAGALDVVDFRLVRVIATSVTLTFGPETDMSLYKGLRLTLTGGGATLSMPVGSRRDYRFEGVQAGEYDMALRNEYGQPLWERKAVEIGEEGLTMAIADIRPMRDLELRVADPQGRDVSAAVTAEWLDADGRTIVRGLKAQRMADGAPVACVVELGDSLGIIYRTPATALTEVSEASALRALTLEPMAEATLSGSVWGGGMQLPGASVLVSQTLNGRYARSVGTSTADDGSFSIAVPDDSLTLTVSAPGYLNATVGAARPADLGRIDLSKLPGSGIAFEYVARHIDYSEDVYFKVPLSGLDDFRFTVTNLTRGGEPVPFVSQNSRLYLTDAEAADRIRIEMTHADGKYCPVAQEFDFRPDESTTLVVNLIEYGGITVKTRGSENAVTEYMLFDASGRFVSSQLRNGNSGASMAHLEEGDYTVVAMGRSDLLGLTGDIDALEAAGLIEGTHYVAAPASVTMAHTSVVELPIVPRLDETPLYYTSDATSFIASNQQPIPGAYVTYTARIEFKDEHKADVSDVALVVDVPDGMEFISNSAIVGTEQVYASTEGSKLVIPLTHENYQQRIRFCLVPLEPGTTFTTAYVRFNAGAAITHPIGRLIVETRELEFTAPEVTARAEIKVGGVATPGASVKVYDGTAVIGTATVLKDGVWSARCTLDDPYNLSRHILRAEVSSASGTTVSTPSRSVLYDEYRNSVSSVTMINTAHPAGTLKTCEYTTVFDFINPKEESQVYWYWPKYPDFTFVVDFMNNSPERVDNVWLKVATTSGTDRRLKASYDSIQNRWIAVDKFPSTSLPTNVSVRYETHNNEMRIDGDRLASIIDEFVNKANEIKELKESFENADKAIGDLLNQSGDDIDPDDAEAILLANGLLDEDDFDSEASSDPDLQAEIKALLESDESSYDAKLTEYLKQFNTEGSRNIFSVIDRLDETWSNVLDGTPVAFGDQTIVFNMFSKGSRPDILDDSFDEFPTTDGRVIYCRKSASELIIIDVDRGYMLRSTTPLSSEISKEYATTGYLADFISYWLDKMGEELHEVNVLLDRLADELDLVSKALDKYADGIEVKIDHIKKVNHEIYEYRKKVLGYRANGKLKSNGRIINFQKELGKTKKSLKRLLKYAKVLKGLFDLPKLWSCTREMYNSAERITEYRFHYSLVKDESERLAKKIVECLGEERAAPHLSAIESSMEYLNNEIWDYFWIDLDKIRDNAMNVLSIIPSWKQVKEFLELCEKGAIAFESIDLVTGITDDLAESYMDRNYRQLERQLNTVLSDIKKRVDFNNCDNDDDDDDDGDAEPEEDPFAPDEQPPMCMIEDYPNQCPVTSVMDPSGYVYEAVTSNRLQGVTATIYEQTAPQTRWAAEEYHQVNPQTTDQSGLYQWDVPIGDWQVRFEKPGYDPTATAWLPVSPPQLDINIPMVHAVNPTVEGAKGYPSGITLKFDKYMIPESIDTDILTAARDGSAIAGKIEFVNLEEDPNTLRSYASKVRFVPDAPFTVGEEIDVLVRKEALSYAEMPLERDAQLRVRIESEITSLTAPEAVAVAPGSAQTIEVVAEPADAAAGQWVAVTAGSSLYSASADRLKLDANGRASVDVNGIILGAAPLSFELEGTDLTAETEVVVTADDNTVGKPRASIPSGTQVDPGTPVALYSATEGATIYYTVDGSCPCDEATRLRYTGPIVIDRDMTLRAQAVKDGMEPSASVTFVYTVDPLLAIDGVIAERDGVIAVGGAILMRGLDGAACTIYDASGIAVWSARAASGDIRVPLPRNRVYLVRIADPSGRVTVNKLLL